MKELEIIDGTTTLKIAINKANILAGYHRIELQNKANTEEDATRWFTHYWFFAACIACTTGTITIDEKETSVLSLSFDDFFSMSDTLTVPWADAVFEINPHWCPPMPTITEEEKKKA